MKQRINNRRGEGYIDIAITILVVVFLLQRGNITKKVLLRLKHLSLIQNRSE